MCLVQQNVDHLFRQQAGKMASMLLKVFGFEHASLIDDIIQETFLAALKHWKMKGVPDHAEAWLMRVAKNKTINVLKKQARLSFETNPDTWIAEEHLNELFLNNEIADSQLRALFACCTPTLPAKTQIMLTLKTLSGFGDAEIAEGILMTPQAVKKTIYRARIQLKKENNCLTVPTRKQAVLRYNVVLKVLYLMFNEGYKTTNKSHLIDEELCFEAIRLGRLLVDFDELDHSQGYALLALMYFCVARFGERQNTLGALISIEHQDRTRWNAGLIANGFECMSKSRRGKQASRYHYESLIAATHCGATTFAHTDWEVIVWCYKKLLELDNSFPIKLNYAIAVGESGGAEKGLQQLKELSTAEQAPSNYVMAAMARFQRKLGKYDLARSYYQVALDLCKNPFDKAFLEARQLEVLTALGVSQN